jgi:D-alanine-D-alanine ligase
MSNQTVNKIPQKGKKTKLPAFIGPVENLENYVNAEWWKVIFNANYIKTDGDVVNDQTITETEVELFKTILTLSPEDNILDLCCGQGRHTLTLARQGYKNLTGLDRSHYLIRRARQQAKNEGLSVQFREGDARKLPFGPDTFDYIIIPGNSFGYFESLIDDEKVLRDAFKVLKPGGKILLDITDGQYIRENFEKRSWEWIDRKTFVCRERSLSSDGQRLISREVITDVNKGVFADQFYAERLFSSDDIVSLLARCGFSNPTIHDELEVKSKRNQDLGMMAKRILVTGVVHKDWTRQKSKTKIKKSVFVLLGDPEIEDIIKPGNQFDEDDLHTVRELKNNLSGLHEYSFTYLDNHRQFINHLFSKRDKIDFIVNLCDEGFNNEATKELHVPALLEMLGIPYSGGNPQCLAYCYDKSLVRGVAYEMEIPTPKAFIIKPDDTTFIDFLIDFPVIVKPNFGDSSIGITQNSVCNNVVELKNAILNLHNSLSFETTVLVEEFLTGKDISVGIIGNLPDNYMILPIIEEDYSVLPDDLPKICGYEAKWMPDSPYWKIKSKPAELPDDTRRFLESSCLKLFARLNLRDYGRFDWRLDEDGKPKLLEVNPNPGWCWDGHLAKMCLEAGISYKEMLQMIVQAAEYRISNQFVTSSRIV